MSDLNQATAFYISVLAAKLEKQAFSGNAPAVLAHADSGVRLFGGARPGGKQTLHQGTARPP